MHYNKQEEQQQHQQSKKPHEKLIHFKLLAPLTSMFVCPHVSSLRFPPLPIRLLSAVPCMSFHFSRVDARKYQHISIVYEML